MNRSWCMSEGGGGDDDAVDKHREQISMWLRYKSALLQKAHGPVGDVCEIGNQNKDE